MSVELQHIYQLTERVTRLERAIVSLAIEVDVHDERQGEIAQMAEIIDMILHPEKYEGTPTV